MKNEGGKRAPAAYQRSKNVIIEQASSPSVVNAVDRACGQVYSISVQEWDKLLHSRSIAERGRKDDTGLSTAIHECYSLDYTVTCRCRKLTG